MSDLTFNKIAGGVLATGLAIFLLREVSGVIFDKHPPEEPGYAIEVDLAEEGAAAEEPPIDWGTVLPIADVQAGERVAAKCVSCHAFEAGGANGTGPALYGVLGRKPASHAGYAYSDALVEYAAANPVWGYENLDAFLEAPQRHVPGTKMTFVGLKQREERISIMAYLHSLGSSLPIPAPNPAAEAAPIEGVEGEAEGAAAPAEGEAAAAEGEAAPAEAAAE